ADDIDADAEPLHSEPRPLSGRDRREVEVRPDSVDDEIAWIPQHEFGEDADRAQGRRRALGISHRRYRTVPSQHNIAQTEDGHGKTAELRDIRRKGPRTAEPERHDGAVAVLIEAASAARDHGAQGTDDPCAFRAAAVAHDVDGDRGNALGRK